MKYEPWALANNSIWEEILAVYSSLLQSLPRLCPTTLLCFAFLPEFNTFINVTLAAKNSLHVRCANRNSFPKHGRWDLNTYVRLWQKFHEWELLCLCVCRKYMCIQETESDEKLSASLRQAEVSDFEDCDITSVFFHVVITVLFGILGLCTWKLLPWGLRSAFPSGEKEARGHWWIMPREFIFPWSPLFSLRKRQSGDLKGLKIVKAGSEIVHTADSKEMSCALLMNLSKAASSLLS